MNNVIDLSETNSALGNYARSFIVQVYGWMVLGLFVTFMSAFGVMFLIDTNAVFANLLYNSIGLLFLVEIAIVIILSLFWRKFNGFISLGMFMLYALINGLFFGVLMYAYTLDSLLVAFAATFLTFGVMAVYGYFTKSDLSKIGSIAIMGLFGLVIGSIINLIITFTNPGFGQGLYWILTYVGLAIFIILVA